VKTVENRQKYRYGRFFDGFSLSFAAFCGFLPAFQKLELDNHCHHV